MQYINYRENKQRGTADFPLEFHHVSPAHPQYLMSFHWHVEFEIIRILEGRFLLSLDEQELTVSKGSVIFIPAGSVHAGTPEEGCVYECIVFDINMLMNKSDSCCRQLQKIINHEVELYSVYPDTYNDIHKTVWSLFDAVSAKIQAYELIVQGALYQFFGTILSEKNITRHLP